MSTKERTVIVNATQQPLTMKVGNRNYFSWLASVEKGGAYAMKLCMDWTYQEFALEVKSDDAGRRLFVTSDDCCDYERMITVEGNMAISKGSEGYQKERLAAIERRVNDKRKEKPGPKRGDIKKGIAKDVMRSFTRWSRTWKYARVAPARDEYMAEEEVGLGA